MTPSTKTKNIIVVSCIVASLLILFVILFPFQFSYVQYYQVLFIVVLLLYKAMYLSSLAKYTNDKTRMSFKSSYSVSNVEMGFIFIGAKEQFWTDALPDTTNGPDGIWTHNLLSMIYEHKPLSQGCLAVPEKFWITTGARITKRET